MSEISKQALKVDNSQSFPDNNAGAITPSDLRAFNVNVIDSLVDEIKYNVDSQSWNNSVDALNTFTSSQQPSFSALNQFTASQININTGVNAFTQSADGRLDNIEQYTASFTTSVGIYDENVLVNNVNQINFTGNGISASFVSGKAVVGVDFTPLNQYTASNTATVSQLLNNFNSFTQSTNNSIDLIEIVTASYATTGSNTFTQNQAFEKNIAVTQSVYVGGNIYVQGGIEATYIKTIYETASVIYSSGSNQFGDELVDTQILSGSTYVEGQLFVNKLNVTDQFAAINTFTASQLVTNGELNQFTASTLLDLDSIHQTTQSLNDYSQSNTARVDTLSSLTGSYATTGSNTFIGDQTLSDATGNSVTLSDASGSLMLVAKTFTSASTHISASTGNQVNLIFKNNSNTADTILSGSNNIFVNAAAPTAGFKRYIGNSNIYPHATSVPQISGSMLWSPVMNGNLMSNTLGIPFTFRGPVSSSLSNINSNILMGGTMNLGSSAALNMEKAVAGINMGGNALFNATYTLTANTTTLQNAIAVNGNLSFGAGVTLNSISSSISFNSNVNNGQLVINNRFSPIGGTAAGALSPRTNVNTLYGTGHAINFDGSNVSTTQTKQFSYNIIAGTFLTGSVPDGDSCSIMATGMIGNGLIVTGSTLTSAATGPEVANSGQGSMFLGRFNALDGNRAKTAQTVFAVGTGTSYTNRKTAFLIDSGSNTFVEGSLNVSGAIYNNVVALDIVSQTASLDMSKGSYFTLPLPTSTSTNINVINLRAGMTAMLEITTATNASASFSTNVKQPVGFAYTPSTGSGLIDVLTIAAFNSSSAYVVNVTNLA